MKTFRCQCGNKLHFENSHCLGCQRDVGYIPERAIFGALPVAQAEPRYAEVEGRRYKRCANYIHYNVCNWLLDADDDQELCHACRLNRTIPNLNEGQNLTLWYRIEAAKRRMLFTVYKLKLPVVGREDDPRMGMAFDFLQDSIGIDEFGNEQTMLNQIKTGHSNGVITINLLEAEHSLREQMRDKMNEEYRTLLGHFRHESGHYYWERLVNGSAYLNPFRQIFGNENLDYQQALKNYYNGGAPVNWQNYWISAYASVHPWEDWAETWAHYLHMVDTLETAHDYGFTIDGYNISQPLDSMQMSSGYATSAGFDELFDSWCRLTVALNDLNRSIGKEDAYPFVIANIPMQKLRFVHELVSHSEQ